MIWACWKNLQLLHKDRLAVLFLFCAIFHCFIILCACVLIWMKFFTSQHTRTVATNSTLSSWVRPGFPRTWTWSLKSTTLYFTCLIWVWVESEASRPAGSTSPVSYLLCREQNPTCPSFALYLVVSLPYIHFLSNADFHEVTKKGGSDVDGDTYRLGGSNMCRYIGI